MLSNVILIFLLVTLSCQAYADSIRFQKVNTVKHYLFWSRSCNGHLDIKDVDIEPCLKARGIRRGMCGVKGGIKTTMNVTFETKDLKNFDTDKLKMHLCGMIAGGCVPLPLKDDSACNGKGLNCPLKDNTKYTFSVTLPISKHYPKMRVKAQFKLYHEDEYLLCINLPLQII